MYRKYVFAFGILILFAASLVAQAGRSDAIEIQIPAPPAVVHTTLGTAIVYELYVVNLTSKTAPILQRLEVFDARRNGKLLYRAEGATIKAAIAKPGDVVIPSFLEPSVRTVVYMWVPIVGGKLPPTVRHRVTVAVQDPTERTLTVDGDAVAVDRRMLAIGPPVVGDNWYVGQGPSNDSGHRRFIFPFDGGKRPRLSQRFAIDIGRVAGKDENFIEVRGDPSRNESYVAYGAQVIAVASGRVVVVKDEISENTPGSGVFAVPINQQTGAGNRIVLDIGHGRFALYGHLRPGSMRVKVGDKVTRGQPLAEIGNSGRSSGPHLHFQIANASDPLDAEGLPFTFERFRILGTCGETDCTPTPYRLVLRAAPVSALLIGFAR